MGPVLPARASKQANGSNDPGLNQKHSVTRPHFFIIHFLTHSGASARRGCNSSEGKMNRQESRENLSAGIAAGIAAGIGASIGTSIGVGIGHGVGVGGGGGGGERDEAAARLNEGNIPTFGRTRQTGYPESTTTTTTTTTTTNYHGNQNTPLNDNDNSETIKHAKSEFSPQRESMKSESYEGKQNSHRMFC